MVPELSGDHHKPTKNLHYTLLQDKGYNRKTQEARNKVPAQDSRDHVLEMLPTQIINSMED